MMSVYAFNLLMPLGGIYLMGPSIFVNFGSSIIINCLWVVYAEELVMETIAGIVRIWCCWVFTKCCKWTVHIHFWSTV